MALFRVILDGIATATTRPPLWPDQIGLCEICLFANDNEDALNRAKSIVEALPFVFLDDHPFTGHQAIIRDLDGPRRDPAEPIDPNLAEERRKMESNARLTGLAFAFMPVGFAHSPQIADTRVIRFLIDPNHPPRRGGVDARQA